MDAYRALHLHITPFPPARNLMTSSTDTTQSSGSVTDRQKSTKFGIEHIGVVGLGHMGHAFAVNLVEDGHQVLVYDRDPKRTAALSGVRAAAELADLASCDVAGTSLPDDDALAAGALRPPRVATHPSPPAAPT